MLDPYLGLTQSRPSLPATTDLVTFLGVFGLDEVSGLWVRADVGYDGDYSSVEPRRYPVPTFSPVSDYLHSHVFERLAGAVCF